MRKRNYFFTMLTCFSLFVVFQTDINSLSVVSTGSFFDKLSLWIKKIEYLLPVFNYKDAILACLIFLFFIKTDEQWEFPRKSWAYRLPAACTAFFLVFGYSFYYTNSWNLVFMDKFRILISVIMMSGYYVLFARIYQLLIKRLLLYQEDETKLLHGLELWIFEKHPFKGAFLVILLCWMPYIIAKYPGASMPETLAEMRQFYWNSLNNYYPPLHTVSMSIIMQIGNAIHSYTFGFFLNLVLQLAMLLSAFSYGFLLMKCWETPIIFRKISLAIICLVQFFPMEATVVEKDIPYTACVIFLFLLLYELLRTMQSEELLSVKKITIWILVAMGVACNRNEGFYLVFASGMGIGIYAFVQFWKANRKKCIRILSLAFLPVIIFIAYQKVLLPACGVADNGLKEVLSIPFQQTARYVRDYGYEVTQEDAEILSKILNYEELGELYDPITSDPVKYTYHAESMEDVAAYFKVWFKQLIKHPGNAVQATMNNVYGWFFQEGYAQNYMMDTQIEGHEVRWEMNQPEFLDGFRQVMERVAKLFSRMPILNWFENAGFVSWMTILFSILLIAFGERRYILSLLPLWTALLVCIAAPTFRYQMRYIMPLMFCLPYYIPAFLASKKQEHE